MKPLPMPIRVAAGLVATVLEEAEHLPRRLTELPVTAVSQALQSAMRVQQKVTDLAIKGDRALSALRPVPEAPSWARFDEDEAPAPNGQGYQFDTADPFSAPYAPQPPRVTPVHILPDPEPDDELGDSDLGDRDLGDRDLDTSDLDRDELEAGARFDNPVVRDMPANSVDTTPPNTTPSSATTGEPTGKADADAPTGPPGLEGYDQWSLPQLRARFRSLKPHQLQALLDWETAHQDRAPYLTMLSNRITSVTGQ